ncbi:MAG: HXXEE domain-containing protein [Alphaproteobacteria bacterium]|nr:HXXEE domain-containing protein [Alphaproteobacteria bacterium]
MQSGLKRAIELWPKTTVYLAIFTSALLLIFRGQMDAALFLIWLQVPVYFLHQFEEYIFPGGFIRYFNINVLGASTPDFPVTRTFAFWINVPIIFIAFPATAFLAGKVGLAFGLWVAWFSILNAFSHVVLFFKQGYNPGFAVSATLNIPVGVGTLAYIATHDLVTIKAQIIGFLIAAVVQGGLMAYGFGVLKPRIKA